MKQGYLFTKVKLLSLCVVLLLAVGCKEQLLHDLSEQDANRMVAKLLQINITAQKERQADGRWTVEVDEKDAGRSLTFLTDNRELKGIQPPAKQRSSLVSSREEQRFEMERLLSTELEGTLATVDGILESRVHLNLPQADPIFGGAQRGSTGSASVLLVVDKEAEIAKSAIVSLVAGASGLPKDSISVIMNRVDAAERVVAQVSAREPLAHTAPQSVESHELPSEKPSLESSDIFRHVGSPIMWLAVVVILGALFLTQQVMMKRRVRRLVTEII